MLSEEKNLDHLPGNEPRTAQAIAYSQYGLRYLGATKSMHWTK
jgi:hypothetical protein